jgi:hypothetical protein
VLSSPDAGRFKIELRARITLFARTTDAAGAPPSTVITIASALAVVAFGVVGRVTYGTHTPANWTLAKEDRTKKNISIGTRAEPKPILLVGDTRYRCRNNFNGTDDR